MKKIVVGSLFFVLSILGSAALFPAQAYEYGDMKSSTLIGKAWQALAKNDLEAVLAYTGKCIELYGAKAEEMQKSLSVYPQGTDSEIFAYWALNDVATGLFIQGEAYSSAKMIDEAVAAYNKLGENYSYGQCYDPHGWFWKPADAAKEKLAMIQSGSKVDMSDNSSQALTGKAWKALADDDLGLVKTYANKCIELYAGKAKEMQASLKEYPWETNEKVFSYWALNDVGTCLFILGKAQEKAGNIGEAKAAFQRIIDEFGYAQTYDPGGKFFWKPVDEAKQFVAAN